MVNFKTFIEQEEEDKDILNTLSKIPRSHAALAQNFRIKFQSGNTLDSDNDNVGYVQDKPKEIVVAAPWRYSREMTFLHEIAHLIFDKLGGGWKKRWAAILAKTPDKQKQSVEEMFCMSYAATYSKHPPLTYCHPEWVAFIKSLPS